MSKKKKDPNAPKNAMSAYFLYSIATRSKVKEENPDATFGDIARIISSNFKALTDEQRAKWDRKAEVDKERYTEEMSNYDAPVDDDNDDECMNNFFLLCHGALENGKEVTKRKTKWEHDRISWYSHIEKLNHEEAFEKTYRMPLKAFDKLV